MELLVNGTTCPLGRPLGSLYQLSKLIFQISTLRARLNFKGGVLINLIFDLSTLEGEKLEIGLIGMFLDSIS